MSAREYPVNGAIIGDVGMAIDRPPLDMPPVETLSLKITQEGDDFIVTCVNTDRSWRMVIAVPDSLTALAEAVYSWAGRVVLLRRAADGTRETS